MKRDKSAGLNYMTPVETMRAMREKQIGREKEGLYRQIRMMDMEYISRVVSSCIIATM